MSISPWAITPQNWVIGTQTGKFLGSFTTPKIFAKNHGQKSCHHLALKGLAYGLLGPCPSRGALVNGVGPLKQRLISN